MIQHWDDSKAAEVRLTPVDRAALEAQVRAPKGCPHGPARDCHAPASNPTRRAVARAEIALRPLRKGIANNFNAFKVERADGALMGPWNPWLHEPAVGKAIWDLTLAMTANAVLPDNVRQIVILVVGARFDAAYEIYANIAVAEREGMK